jgi:hypothetical protein
MFIIPYTHKTIMIQQMKVTAIQILTVGGICLWKEENARLLEKYILHPNGIYIKGKPVKHKDMYLCCVDTAKTEMSDFYKWDELDATDDSTFCLRTFYLMGEKEHPHSWLSIPNEQWEPCRYQELFDLILKEV